MDAHPLGCHEIELGLHDDIDGWNKKADPSTPSIMTICQSQLLHHMYSFHSPPSIAPTLEPHKCTYHKARGARVSRDLRPKFPDLLGKAIGQGQNLDIGEFGKGALSAKNPPRPRTGPSNAVCRRRSSVLMITDTKHEHEL